LLSPVYGTNYDNGLSGGTERGKREKASSALMLSPVYQRQYDTCSSTKGSVATGSKHAPVSPRERTSFAESKTDVVPVWSMGSRKRRYDEDKKSMDRCEYSVLGHTKKITKGKDDVNDSLKLNAQLSNPAFNSFSSEKNHHEYVSAISALDSLAKLESRWRKKEKDSKTSNESQTKTSATSDTIEIIANETTQHSSETTFTEASLSENDMEEEEEGEIKNQVDNFVAKTTPSVSLNVEEQKILSTQNPIAGYCPSGEPLLDESKSEKSENDDMDLGEDSDEEYIQHNDRFVITDDNGISPRNRPTLDIPVFVSETKDKNSSLTKLSNESTSVGKNEFILEKVVPNIDGKVFIDLTKESLIKFDLTGGTPTTVDTKAVRLLKASKNARIHSNHLQVQKEWVDLSPPAIRKWVSLLVNAKNVPRKNKQFKNFLAHNLNVPSDRVNKVHEYLKQVSQMKNLPHQSENENQVVSFEVTPSSRILDGLKVVEAIGKNDNLCTTSSNVLPSVSDDAYDNDVSHSLKRSRTEMTNFSKATIEAHSLDAIKRGINSSSVNAESDNRGSVPVNERLSFSDTGCVSTSEISKETESYEDLYGDLEQSEIAKIKSNGDSQLQVKPDNLDDASSSNQNKIEAEVSHICKKDEECVSDGSVVPESSVSDDLAAKREKILRSLKSGSKNGKKKVLTKEEARAKVLKSMRMKKEKLTTLVVVKEKSNVEAISKTLDNERKNEYSSPTSFDGVVAESAFVVESNPLSHSPSSVSVSASIPAIQDITALSQPIIIQNISRGPEEKVRICHASDDTPITTLNTGTRRKAVPNTRIHRKAQSNTRAEDMSAGAFQEVKEAQKKNEQLQINLARLKQQLETKKQQKMRRMEAPKNETMEEFSNPGSDQNSLLVQDVSKDVCGITGEASLHVSLIEEDTPQLRTKVPDSDSNESTNEVLDIMKKRPPSVTNNDHVENLRKRQRELRHEIDISNLKQIASKQKELLANQKSKLLESNRLLEECSDELNKHEVLVSESEKQLAEYERRRSIMDNMLMKAQERLLDARRRLAKQRSLVPKNRKQATDFF